MYWVQIVSYLASNFLISTYSLFPHAYMRTCTYTRLEPQRYNFYFKYTNFSCIFSQFTSEFQHFFQTHTLFAHTRAQKQQKSDPKVAIIMG